MRSDLLAGILARRFPLRSVRPLPRARSSITTGELPLFAEFRDAFVARYRWPLILAGAIAAVLATVVLYQVTTPKPEQVGGVDVKELPEAQILRVGALPVT